MPPRRACACHHTTPVSSRLAVQVEGPSPTACGRLPLPLAPPVPRGSPEPIPVRDWRFSPEVEGSSSSFGPHTFSPMGPIYSPKTPSYNPTSPSYTQDRKDYLPASPEDSPTKPSYSPTSPGYNPTSPEYKPFRAPPAQEESVPVSPPSSPSAAPPPPPRSPPAAPSAGKLVRQIRPGQSKFSGPIRSPVPRPYSLKMRNVQKTSSTKAPPSSASSFKRAEGHWRPRVKLVRGPVRTPKHGFPIAVLLSAKRSTREETHRKPDLFPLYGFKRSELRWGEPNENTIDEYTEPLRTGRLSDLYAYGKLLRESAARKRQEREAEEMRAKKVRTQQQVEDWLVCSEDLRGCMCAPVAAPFRDGDC